MTAKPPKDWTDFIWRTVKDTCLLPRYWPAEAVGHYENCVWSEVKGSLQLTGSVLLFCLLLRNGHSNSRLCRPNTGSWDTLQMYSSVANLYRCTIEMKGLKRDDKEVLYSWLWFHKKKEQSFKFQNKSNVLTSFLVKSMGAEICLLKYCSKFNVLVRNIMKHSLIR